MAASHSQPYYPVPQGPAEAFRPSRATIPLKADLKPSRLLWTVVQPDPFPPRELGSRYVLATKDVVPVSTLSTLLVKSLPPDPFFGFRELFSRTIAGFGFPAPPTPIQQALIARGIVQDEAAFAPSAWRYPLPHDQPPVSNVSVLDLVNIIAQPEENVVPPSRWRTPTAPERIPFRLLGAAQGYADVQGGNELASHFAAGAGSPAPPSASRGDFHHFYPHNV